MSKKTVQYDVFQYDYTDEGERYIDNIETFGSIKKAMKYAGDTAPKGPAYNEVQRVTREPLMHYHVAETVVREEL